jgi:hypothetical protein
MFVIWHRVMLYSCRDRSSTSAALVQMLSVRTRARLPPASSGRGRSLASTTRANGADEYRERGGRQSGDWKVSGEDIEDVLKR